MGDEVEKLSGKLGIDTTDFKTSLGAANRELRVLESGFRAGSAALGDYSKSADGLEMRAKSLTQQIDIQKLKVAALSAEHARLAQENGATSRSAQDAQIKLNKETETLGKMDNELRTTNTALKDMTKGEKDVGQAAEEGRKKIQTLKDVMNGLGNVAKAAGGLLLGMVGTVIALAGAITGLALSTAKSAGELNDLSLKTGVSTTRLQELAYVGDQVGTSQESIVSSLTKLTRSMSAAATQTEDYTTSQEEAAASGDEFTGQMGTQQEAFDKLGVSVTDASGNLRDNEAVFADVIDALGGVNNEAERDALAMTIFGKSAQELNPLIKTGSKELANLSSQAHEVGAVMGEETVQAFAEFDDTVVSLQASFKGVMGMLASAFLPILVQLADALKQTFSSAEFKAGLAALVEGLSKFASQVISNMPQIIQSLRSVANWVITNIPLMVQAFKNISNWFLTNKPIIVGVLAAIGAAIAVFVYTTVIPAAAAAIAAMIPIVVAALPIIAIVAAIGAAVGLLYAAWTNNWGGIQGKVAAVWAVLQPIFAGIVNWFKTSIPAAIKILSGYWTNTLQPAMSKVGTFLSVTLFPLIQAVAKFLGAVFGLELKLLSAVWTNVLQPALIQVWGVIDEKIMPIFAAIVDFVQNSVMPVLDALGKIVNDVLVAAFVWLAEKIQIVIDWLNTVVDIINGIVLPDWLTGGGGANAEALGEAWARGLGAGFKREFAQMQSAMGGLTLSPAFAVTGSGGRNLSAAGAGQQPFIFNNYGTLNFENDSIDGLKEMLTASRY
jgi:hypothetical protein